MTTLGTWVSEVRRHVEGPKPGVINTLASAYTAASGTLAFTQNLGGITPGAVLSIGENTLVVTDTDEGAKTAEVIAGWNGSTDANAGDGTVVRVNPQFTDHHIVTELNYALGSLTAPDNGLFQVATVDLAYVSGVQGYDLDVDDLVRVLRVRRQTSGSSLSWPKLRGGEWEVIEDADTDVFPSGRALQVQCAEPGYAVRVTYAAPFTSISGLATDVATSGIPSTAHDLPPLAAAVAIMTGREVPRNTLASQGDTRRPAEVPPGAVARSWGGLAVRLQTRTREEAHRLRVKYPITR